MHKDLTEIRNLDPTADDVKCNSPLFLNQVKNKPESWRRLKKKQCKTICYEEFEKTRKPMKYRVWF